MKKYLTSFGGAVRGSNRHEESFGIIRDYTPEVHRLFKSAELYFDECLFYDNVWFENSDYCKNNPWTLNEDSYGWTFKPCVVHDLMVKIDDGDIVMWTDSNHTFAQNPQKIFDFVLLDNCFIHDHWNVVYPNAHWTTRDMFQRMGCDEMRYWQARQMQVNIFAFRKCKWTMKFMSEWKDYALDYDTMIANEEKNLPGFRERRHEQSIFSILAEKYKLPFHPYPIYMIPELDGIDARR